MLRCLCFELRPSRLGSRPLAPLSSVPPSRPLTLTTVTNLTTHDVWLACRKAKLGGLTICSRNRYGAQAAACWEPTQQSTTPSQPRSNSLTSTSTALCLGTDSTARPPTRRIGNPEQPDHIDLRRNPTTKDPTTTNHRQTTHNPHHLMFPCIVFLGGSINSCPVALEAFINDHRTCNHGWAPRRQGHQSQTSRILELTDLANKWPSTFSPRTTLLPGACRTACVAPCGQTLHLRRPA